MKIKLISYPYKDYEVGEIVDLGEDKNRSMVSLQRAVWVEEEEKKKRTPKKTVTKTATQTQDDVIEEEEKPAKETEEVEETKKPTRGPDGKFVSKEETENTEKPKKKGFLSRLR
ncbi:hypothetical protein KKH23_02910 [Patescibacteria group bacterium]|nr:hypothetical protein [Patescibacteria group bacterium]MBU0777304.1 hypothetical protein [Patescibacteria group bacterium]MBU0846116.1 hypothetical protein [Patescibacteria group bacterium]MBU0923170.1 hypothetical protein [Patescibacteria group bacterium]MBU1066884.1 hypothetical protein [Patescibacteria group bacterium]